MLVLLYAALICGCAAPTGVVPAAVGGATASVADYPYTESGFDVLCPANETPGEGRFFLTLYQRRLSVHGKARCRFYPTCSAFYREALDLYGSFWATLMLLDRLLYREHAWSLNAYPLLGNPGLHRDPVHRNFIFDEEGYFR
jgi:putative component of membrane protein insertase Oxa1/YidC/SpoIIIJ protein YidD